MPSLRVDVLVAVMSIAAMLIVRFWAALAGDEILGLVTLLRIVVGAAILGGVTATVSQRTRTALAMVGGASVATVIASIFTRGGFDPEAAAGASLMAAVVAAGAFAVVRRIVAWVASRGRVVQVLLAVLGLVVAIALIGLAATAR